jgi:RNA polymerase sigma factor (sigma-70 family)
MTSTRPLSDDYEPEPSDEVLVVRGMDGDAEALETLIRRHQRWIYNLALRILQSPQDAEDATQESLVKIVTRLATFRGDSAFRTWAYRVAMRHVLDCKRSRPEQSVHGFGCLGSYLAQIPDEESAPDHHMLVEEARLGCMMGMLLCLDREQRLVFVVGEVFEASDVIASAILEISRDAYRQQLARARGQLQSFMRDQCGLIDPANPCRCAKKTRGFVRDGIVDPARLQFYRPHVEAVRDAAPSRAHAITAIARDAAALFREHPFYEVPDMAERLRALLVRSTLGLAQKETR